jgi:hypothetical protein
MFETELGGGIRVRIALGFESTAKSADCAELSRFRKRRTALRASSFGWGCRHCLLLATAILLDPARSGVQKEFFDDPAGLEESDSNYDLAFALRNGFLTKAI